MHNVINIFMYKGLVCGHCDNTSKNFVYPPQSFNPPKTVIYADNVGITKEAREFIRLNNTTVQNGFFFVSFLTTDEKPLIELFGTADIFVLNLGANLPITVGSDPDMGILDKFNELGSYTPPAGIIKAVTNYYGQLASH